MSGKFRATRRRVGKARWAKPRSLADVWGKMAKKRLGKGLIEYQAVRVWPKVAGEKIAKRCVALGIKSGILHIVVPTNVWRTELITLKEKLIKNLNRELGRDVVKNINFQVGATKRK